MRKNQRPARAGQHFPIVGIGASAGGLEAYRVLLAQLPVDTGLGFVLVQHLDPAHESGLTQLLARVTPIPVTEVTNNLRVQPNHVYVIPPNTNLSIAGGVLKLKPRAQSRLPARSIDSFLESLAEDQRERAIGVILSGTATDGTLGLEAIKAEGGITFAQDDSAKYDSMPRSAIAAGCVDFVLAPADIALELARIAKHPYVVGDSTAAPIPTEDDRAMATAHEDDATPLPSGGHGAPRIDAKRAHGEAATAPARAGDNGFRKVLLLLRNHCGVDFSLYKSATIQRRIARRMVLNKQDTPERYAALLRGNGKELDALYSDVLISVTSFFRNAEAFGVLTRKVFPKLLQQRGDDPVRVWVLGCSTGQEAYSIAMAFVDAAEKAPRLRKLQLFATDLNDALLDKARHGLYAKTLAQDIAPERLRRFFVEEEGGYRISKALREMVVFARQNVISDAPFSRMDLISCRNLLIYLEPSLQKKILPMFHYALKPHGMLFLGASESIGGLTDLFEPVDKKHKIYAKKAAPTPLFRMPGVRPHDRYPSPGAGGEKTPVPIAVNLQRDDTDGFRTEFNAQREADRVTVSRFAPPGLLINADLQILQFRGPTSAYLVPPTGKASFDVLKMAREGLMLPLRAAINQAKKSNTTARRENVSIAQNGGTRTVNLQVIPLKNLRERSFLILFEEAAGTAPSVRFQSRGKPQMPRRAARGEKKDAAALSRELSETRDYLQSVQEQYEAASEELQASNEEVQSANEELQSINEELETSKEELESTNEELTTVNEEMTSRNIELSRLNSDLVNVQTSTNQPIVLLGRDLTIRRFSAPAGILFNLIAADIGRPFSGVRHDLDIPDLEAVITDVITSVRPWECDVQNRAGRWCSVRVRPYLTLDNKVDGAVLVLVDIDDRKRAELAAGAALDFAEGILRTARDPLLVLSADLRVHSANEAFYRLFRVQPAHTEGQLIYELGNGEWNIPRLRNLLHDILPESSVFNDFEVVHDFLSIGRRTMLLNARTLRGVADAPARILLGIQDVSERLQFQAAARDEALRYQALVEASAQTVWTTDKSGAVVEDSPSWRAFTGQTSEERKGFGWLNAIHPDDRERVRTWWQHTVAELKSSEIECCIRHTSGEWRWTAMRVVAVLNSDGSVRERIGMNVDIDDRKRAEEALLAADRHKDEFLATLAHELRNPLAPIRNTLQIVRLAGQGDERFHAALEVMERQLSQLVRLVDDLLDVSRISRGKIALHPGTVELASVVHDAVEAASSLHQSLEQEVTVSVAQEPLYVRGDSTRLMQVVGNLLNNAGKFTGRGGSITLTLTRDGTDAVIRVRDSGIGIPADQLTRIFDMFTQVDVSLKRSPSHAGLGIGLALVKMLVELHGGTVAAQSAGVDHGSEFIVRLPLLLEAPQSPSHAEPSISGRAVMPRRILVVDDNRDAAESLAELLQMSGHEVHVAYDGLQAVDTAHAVRPALVLLDIGLPGLNGYDVARRIRESPWGKDALLVALTGWGQEEDRQQSRDAGFDAHMVKPVDPDALEKLLAEVRAG